MLRGHNTLLFFGQRRNEILYAWDEDLALRSDEFAHEGDQIRHRLVHRSSKDTRVQIARRAGDSHFVVRDTSKTIGQAWCPCIKPIVVRL